MSNYKVIQDIEAEDKLLGPLTLRQFIYAAFVAVMGFIAFKLSSVSIFFIIPFLPPMIFFGLLAAPFGHDQSSEVWLLAKIRFFLKPRRRIWDQSGLQELVTITVPKKVERHLTDGLNQTEVKSRLQALANTIDSRGWAVKNINVNMFRQPSYVAGGTDNSDRLLDASNLPQEVPAYDVFAQDDIMDESNNPTARQLGVMIDRSEQSHRQAIMANVQGAPMPASAPAAYMFAPTLTSNNPITTTPAALSQAQAVTTDDDKKLLEQIKQEKRSSDQSYRHMRTISPHNKPKNGTHRPTTKPHTSKPTNAEVNRLASNDDLSVATIAREANKSKEKDSFDEEVVISLR